MHPSQLLLRDPRLMFARGASEKTAAPIGKTLLNVGKNVSSAIRGSSVLGNAATAGALGAVSGALDPGTNPDGSTKSRVMGAIRRGSGMSIAGGAGTIAAKRLNTSVLAPALKTSAKKIGSIVLPAPGDLVKIAFNFSNIGNVVRNAGPVGWGMTGAAVGGAMNAINPGVDENGNPRSRTLAAIRGAGTGALMGGLGGLAVNRVQQSVVGPLQAQAQADRAARAARTPLGATRTLISRYGMDVPKMAHFEAAMKIAGIADVLTNAGPIGWGLTGGAVGAATGALNPGVDEAGNPRNRHLAALRGMGNGMLVGALGGHAVNQVNRNIVQPMIRTAAQTLTLGPRDLKVPNIRGLTVTKNFGAPVKAPVKPTVKAPAASAA